MGQTCADWVGRTDGYFFSAQTTSPRMKDASHLPREMNAEAIYVLQEKLKNAKNKRCLFCTWFITPVCYLTCLVG